MKSQLVTSYTLKHDAMEHLHTVDQYLSPLRYFLIITTPVLLNCNIMLNNNKISGIYILTNLVIYK
jgi:hypothetical protein